MGNKFSTKKALSLQTHKSCIYQVLQLNNVELATCSSEKNIDIWNIETGLIDITLTGYSTPVTSLVYMHDGRLASGSLEKSIKIWTYDTHRCDFTMMAHEGPIRALIQLKDHSLASGSDDTSVKILDLSSMWFSHTFKEHKGPVRALAQLLDGRLVSGSDDKVMNIYDLKHKRLQGSVNIGQKITSLLVVNKSGLLLVGCRKIKVFDMSNKEEFKNAFDLTGHNTDINNMINIGVDGVRVITAAKNTVKIWNVVNKTLEKQLDGHKGGTYGMDIMTDGRLVTSGGDGELKIWSIISEEGDNINLKTGENLKAKEDDNTNMKTGQNPKANEGNNINAKTEDNKKEDEKKSLSSKDVIKNVWKKIKNKLPK